MAKEKLPDEDEIPDLTKKVGAGSSIFEYNKFNGRKVKILDKLFNGKTGIIVGGSILGRYHTIRYNVEIDDFYGEPQVSSAISRIIETIPTPAFVSRELELLDEQ